MSKLPLLAGVALLFLVASRPVIAQSALELQRQAADKQREAARKQLGITTPPAENSFFTTGAPTPMPGTPGTGSGGGAVAVPAGDCDALPPTQVEELVKTSAEKNSVSAVLIKAVMQQESAFKPCAVSPKGAQGLMQLMPATAQELKVSDPFDPAQNVAAGAALLKQLLDRYNGDTKLALSAYNAGTAAVDKIKDIPAIPETQAYVADIIKKIQ